MGTRKPKSPTLTQRVTSLEHQLGQARHETSMLQMDGRDHLARVTKRLEALEKGPAKVKITIYRSGPGWHAEATKHDPAYSFPIHTQRLGERWRWTRRGAEKAIEKAVQSKLRRERGRVSEYTYEVAP